MFTKCDEWPKVLPNDDGIRPAGGPDRCFYCDSKVGQPHKNSCVCVYQKLRYRVMSDEVQVGIWDHTDPFSWEHDFCETHKNDLTWCADNALDGIVWLDTSFAKKVKEFVFGEDEDNCSCNVLRFEVEMLLDAGPFIWMGE